MRTLTNEQVKVKSYRIHLMEMVINAIYYNPVCLHRNLKGLQTDNLLGPDSPRARDETVDQQVLQLVVLEH